MLKLVLLVSVSRWPEATLTWFMVDRQGIRVLWRRFGRFTADTGTERRLSLIELLIMVLSWLCVGLGLFKLYLSSSELSLICCSSSEFWFRKSL